MSFNVKDFVAGGPNALVLPVVGDVLRMRMHPGPDIRSFRCTGRVFDFSEWGAPVLHIELDMPEGDLAVG